MSAEDAAKWRERLLERAGKELQLDDAQKQRLGVVFDKMREQRTALVGSTTEPARRTRHAGQGDSSTRRAPRRWWKRRPTPCAARARRRSPRSPGFYDSLKPEQQQKLRDFMDKRHGGWRG